MSQTVQPLRLTTKDHLNLPAEVIRALKRGHLYMYGYTNEGIERCASNLTGFVAIVQTVHLRETERYSKGPHWPAHLCSFNAPKRQPGLYGAWHSAAKSAALTAHCCRDYGMPEVEWYDRDMRVLELWQLSCGVRSAVLWAKMGDEMASCMSDAGLSKSALLREWVKDDDIADDLAFKVTGGPRQYAWADVANRRNGEILRGTIEAHDREHGEPDIPQAFLEWWHAHPHRHSWLPETAAKIKRLSGRAVTTRKVA